LSLSFTPRIAAAESPAGAGPEDLLHLARERLRHGDYEGVRIVAEQALEIPGDHQRTAQYLIAMSLELGGDPDEALRLYDALEAAWAVSAVPDDLRFRRAECLGRLGRYGEARAELGRLTRVERPALDQLKIDALLGIWTLELGHTRRGLRSLERTLAGAEAGVGTYYQAAARHAILAGAIDDAEQIAFVGGDRAKRRDLERRTGLIRIANDQLAAIILTDETSFSLDGFLRLGRAHASLGRALLDESPIRGLTDEQLAINRGLLEERVRAIWVRGTLYYDRGIQLAARMGWTGEPVPTLRAEHEALVDQVDGMPVSSGPPAQ
jgi:tetratricopeptide (TPR) repeat protein